jgi:glycosyltransferase involved in cell wall biosynthesis
MIKNRSNIKLRYQILDLALRLGNISIASRSIHLRAGFNYLRNLIAEGRFAEVDALLARGLSKTLVRAPLKRRQKRDLFIDARTERLNPDGTIVPLETVKLEPRSEPLVSIIIPCFNYGRYLYDAVNSALSQTVQSLEIIIVNDGSTDAETIRILNEIAGIERVKVIHQDNAGLPAARNTGISHARGEFITCLDADDTLDPTYVECTIALLVADLSVGFAYSYVRCFGDVDDIWLTHDFDPEEALYANFTAVSATFRRADWEAIGGYAPSMRGGFEDWEFWIRLSTLGRRGRAIKWPLFNHRRHGRTMTHDAKDMKEELQSRIRQLNPLFFTDISLRKRLSRLGPAAASSPNSFQILSENTKRTEPRPTLLVIIPWLRAGGAEHLLAAILQGIVSDFNIVVATTTADSHRLSSLFKTITQEIFHLAEMFETAEERSNFLVHLANSRNITHVLTSLSEEAINNLSTLKRTNPNIFTVNILHNKVADSVYRAAIFNGKFIDRHVIVAKDIEDSLIALGLDESNIVYIPNGIRPPPITLTKLEARQTLGVFNDILLLVWIGRFAKEKQPLEFVKIIKRIAGKIPVIGYMVGDGPELSSIKASISENDLNSIITLTGHIERADLGKIFAAADALVLTSSVEGMPLVILEALSCGIPIAATNVGDISRLLKDKPYGLLVEPDDVIDLSENILFNFPAWRLLNREEIINAINSTAYSENAMINRYRELLLGAFSTKSN